MWVAGQIGPFAQQLRWRAGQQDEDVPSRRFFCGLKNSLFALQIEAAPWMRKKDSPALRARSRCRSNDPGDGDARSVSCEARTSLPIPHSIRGAPAIERMTSLPETENRAPAEVKVNRAGGGLKLKPLSRLAFRVRDVYLPGSLCNADFEFAPGHGIIRVLR